MIRLLALLLLLPMAGLANSNWTCQQVPLSTVTPKVDIVCTPTKGGGKAVKMPQPLVVTDSLTDEVIAQAALDFVDSLDGASAKKPSIVAKVIVFPEPAIEPPADNERAAFIAAQADVLRLLNVKAAEDLGIIPKGAKTQADLDAAKVASQAAYKAEYSGLIRTK